MAELGNDLFDGLQIMSPEELNSAVKATEDGAEDTGATSDSSDSEFTLEPVETEKGEGAYENKPATEEKPAAEKIDTSAAKSEAVYKALMKELVTAGILTSAEVEQLDELPGTLDTIKDLMTKTVETNFKTKEERWKQSLPSEKKRFLEIEDAFDETDQAILMAQRLEFFENVNAEQIKNDVNLQKQIYFEQLKSKNFSDEDALEAIADAEAVNKLQDKAFKAIPELKSQANAVIEHGRSAKEAKTRAEQEAQSKMFDSLVANIDSRDAFIDGLNLNKVAKDKLKQNIMSSVYKDPKTGAELNSLMYKQQRNPVEFEMLINYYDTIGLFNLDKEGKFKPDITKLKTVAKTAAINELDKVIAAEEQRGVGRNTSVETSQKTEGLLNMLESAFAKK
jgi:hypothetical protein